MHSYLNFAIVLAVAALALTGCGDDTGSIVDSGLVDGGRDVLVDTPPDVARDIPCVPDCMPLGVAKECGDDGCGGSCGECPAGQVCGGPVAPVMCVCAPQCEGKVCGDDTCGGSCGDCPGEGTCDEAGMCDCTPDCTFDGVVKMCGDDRCGGSCGECEEGLGCGGELGLCICEDIAPIYDRLDLAIRLNLATAVVGPQPGFEDDAVLRIAIDDRTVVTAGAMFGFAGDMLRCTTVDTPATCTDSSVSLTPTDILFSGNLDCLDWFNEALRTGFELECGAGGSMVTAIDICEDSRVRIFPTVIAVTVSCEEPLEAPAPTCMPAA